MWSGAGPTFPVHAASTNCPIACFRLRASTIFSSPVAVPRGRIRASRPRASVDLASSWARPPARPRTFRLRAIAPVRVLLSIHYKLRWKGTALILGEMPPRIERMLMLKRFVLTLLLLLVTNIPGLAQDWPPKIVRIVVPFGPGSTPD